MLRYNTRMGAEIVAGIKVVHVVGVVVVLAMLAVLKRLLGGAAAASEHHLQKRCASCGWSGSVSKYKPVCPGCAKPL